MLQMAELSDLELLNALGVDVTPKKKKGQTAREERIIAGFEEIQKFVNELGHVPQHGENKDIFERLYATRLDQIKNQQECLDLLQKLDHQSLLNDASGDNVVPEGNLSDEELLAELGITPPAENDISVLRHVKSRAEIRAAEEIANRTKCEDFDNFIPIFKNVQNEINSGVRTTLNFVKDAGFVNSSIIKGQFFILGGQIAYVAELGDKIKAPNGETDARLRVIYSNGTESNLLLRSLQRALYKDEAGRRISEPSAGPLFSGVSEDDDLASGTVYVLRSKSDHPIVCKNREIVHKIGVTKGKVSQRISKAKTDPTYLMADVEVVAEYKLFNLSQSKFEKLIHKFFNHARLEIEVIDRFGTPVVPQEWFLIPLFIIDEVVRKIIEGTIGQYIYDIESAKLIRNI